jgi:putative selenate reductase
MFDCVACTNCVSVCPNDAFFQVPSKDREDLEARAQYLVLAELCNDCGNCTTFCPEEGAPHQIKPRLFTDPAAWETAGRQGFLLSRTTDQSVSVQGAEDKDVQLVENLVQEEKWLKSCLKEGPR